MRERAFMWMLMDVDVEVRVNEVHTHTHTSTYAHTHVPLVCFCALGRVVQFDQRYYFGARMLGTLFDIAADSQRPKRTRNALNSLKFKLDGLCFRWLAPFTMLLLLVSHALSSTCLTSFSLSLSLHHTHTCAQTLMCCLSTHSPQPSPAPSLPSTRSRARRHEDQAAPLPHVCA